MSIHAHQHSTRQVTDGKVRMFSDQEWIERLWLGAQAKAQFAAVLREGCTSDQSRSNQHEAAKKRQECALANHALANHAGTSSFDNSNWNDVMTTISSTSGTSRQGSSRDDFRPSSSRSGVPHEGKGSATPSPRMPRFASLKMKTGIEIQNCAYKTGFRLGRT